MIATLLLFVVGSIALVPLTRLLGRRVFWLAALVPLVGLLHACLNGPAVVGGAVITESHAWVPQLGLSLATRLDVLSWTMVLIVTAVGSLVLFYCAAYFRADEEGLGRFASTLLAFAGAMYGLVVADNVFLLFVFWEATSVFSYLLIGQRTGSLTSRAAALQALLVTTLGGLVMLVGLVLLAVRTGTSSLSGIIAESPDGTLVVTAIMLILVGALSKSAIFPLHFWLPAAMAAPTPVSAYLHAAAMVKAGVYLVARLAPGFAEIPGWREVLVGLGVVTMILGGLAALRQFDIKLLLAYGTVSQLGFLIIVLGLGTRDAALAGLALLLAHALFKSALFLTVGIIDHNAGTRDLRKLSGLGRRAPWLAVIATVALASMVGLPPTLGFVAKEAIFTSLLTSALAGFAIGWFALAGVVLGSILTVAYSARFLWGAFAKKPGLEVLPTVRQRPAFLSAPGLLALGGLAFGLVPYVVDAALAGYSTSFEALTDESYHLALWHGLEPALGVSVLTLGIGLLLFWQRDRVSSLQARLGDGVSAGNAYWASVRFVDRVAAATTSATQRGSLPFYLGVILLVFVLTTGAALVFNGTWPENVAWWDDERPVQLAIAVVMIAASIAATRANNRFQAIVLVGVTGYGLSALFALQGAPDLALTQILVEVVTLVAFVLVIRRLPAQLGARHGSVNRLPRALLAVAVGAIMGTVALIALGARVDPPISLDFPRLAFEQGHGRNVVNVTLVDIRGWDTMGELSVIIAAATGVASLIFISTRTDTLPRLPRREARRAVRERRQSNEQAASGVDAPSSWLLAGRTLAARNRSILLEVVVRLIFHSIIVVSVFLLFAGHNGPGGGFAGGLVAGLALVARYLAGGRLELGAAAPIDAGKVLGAGLVLAAGTALVPLFFGAEALTSTWIEGEVWLFGHVEFVTSTIFDMGVYLVVVGLVLDVLRSLGAEVDHQQARDRESARS